MRDARFLVLANLEDVQRWGDQWLALKLFREILLREGYASELQTSCQQLVREDADDALLEEVGVRLGFDKSTIIAGLCCSSALVEECLLIIAFFLG